jgi:hypothetical protein
MAGILVPTPQAGGMTLLSTTTLSGASTTISGINQSYTDLILVATNVYAAAANTINCRFNADDTSGNYSSNILRTQNGTVSGDVNVSNGFIGSCGDQTGNLTRTSFRIEIPRYSFTENHRIYSSLRGNVGTERFCITNMSYSSTTAISSIKLQVDSTTFTAGTVYLYGVK